MTKEQADRNYQRRALLCEMAKEIALCVREREQQIELAKSKYNVAERGIIEEYDIKLAINL